MWKVIDTGLAYASENMRIDQELLQNLSDDPIIHFYDWKEEAATYGYFVRPESYLDFEKVGKRGLFLARRPTGGGIVFHKWDFAFSVLIPSNSPFFSMNTLENYGLINRAVLSTVKKFLQRSPELIFQDAESFDITSNRFCMARPTKYDVVMEGKKVAGAAQRRDKKGFLHQGMIALQLPDEEYLRDVLLPGSRVVEAMRNFTYPLLGKETGKKQCDEAKRELKVLLQKYLVENI